MRFSWIKAGTRVAVLIIIYLLLSIPDTKYQYFDDEVVYDTPFSSIDELLLTQHISSILKLSEDEKARRYDSLVKLTSVKLNALKSEILTSDDSKIDSMTYLFGLSSAYVGLSSASAQPILENLWLWRQYLKKQSLFWNVNNPEHKLHIAATMSFVGICEDFIVTSQNLIYTKKSNSPASIGLNSTLSNIRSGDLMLNADDISFSYLEQAKFVSQLTPSLGFFLLEGDSSFYITTSPAKGLHIMSSNEFLDKPFSKRLQLRLRDDLPELISNPLLPHQAANFVYSIASEHTINYNFSFNPGSRSSLCETGMIRFAYEGQNMNFISSYSPVNNAYVYGLNRLGIKNDTRATASEIQFHPSIEVVGIQLSGEGIKARNLEMALSASTLTTIDAKLMKYLRWKLPYYRLIKGYSSLAILLGTTPIIPNGMAPETAIINNYIVNRNKTLLPLLINSAAQFENENQYYPTYTMLCQLAITNLTALENK